MPFAEPIDLPNFVTPPQEQCSLGSQRWGSILELAELYALEASEVLLAMHGMGGVQRFGC